MKGEHSTVLPHIIPHIIPHMVRPPVVSWDTQLCHQQLSHKALNWTFNLLALLQSLISCTTVDALAKCYTIQNSFPP